MQLVLASSSPYRRDSLARLGVPFMVACPDIDETPHSGETPPALAARLATEQSRAVAPQFPDSLVIGSD